MKRYCIEYWDECIILYGSVPVQKILDLEKEAKKHGFDQINIGIAQALQACMVITNNEGAKKLIEIINKRDADKSEKEKWLSGIDTGLSSKTIYQVMTGQNIGSRGDYPHDSDDFGRCYRLLELFPEWKSRMDEVSEKYPEGWRELVPVWEELTKMYVNKEYEKMYSKMKEVLP